MRVLVTGSAGFIGTRLAAQLRQSGHHVLGIDRRFDAHPDHFRWDLADGRWAGPLHDLASEVDIVFHLAARPGVRDQRPAVERLRHRDNVLATQAVVAATPLSVPLVVTSSSSVYGGAREVDGGVRPSHETDPLRPRGGYAVSKVATEQICRWRRSRGGIVTVLRPFTVGGEGQRSDMAFAVWTAALREGLPVRLLGSPNRTRDITDIADVVKGLIRAGQVGYNGTVNLGSGVAHRLSDMAGALMAVAGVTGELLLDAAGPEEAPATLADTERCQHVLGFVPATDLKDVARRVWEGLSSPVASASGVAAR